MSRTQNQTVPALELFVQVSSPTESCWGLQEPYFAQWDFISNHLEPINKIHTYGYIHNTYILCCLWIPSCSHIPCLSQALGSVRHGSSWTLSSQNSETKWKEAFEGINAGAGSRVSARVRKKPCLGCIERRSPTAKRRKKLVKKQRKESWVLPDPVIWHAWWTARTGHANSSKWDFDGFIEHTYIVQI